MSNLLAQTELDEIDAAAGADRAARLLAVPAFSRFDERCAAEDAIEQAEELLAHLRRSVRTLDAAPSDEEARIDVGQDVLELTAVLREYALGAYLLGR